MRNTYTYNIRFNLFHDVFDDYYLKTDLDATHIEIDSESFKDYKECSDDCNQLLSTFKEYLETLANTEILQAWELNPSRDLNEKKVQKVSLTKLEDWHAEEILHIFLFIKDEEITQKTTPIAKVSIMVKEYNEDFIPYVN